MVGWPHGVLDGEPADLRHRREGGIVGLHNGASASPEALELRELSEPEGRLQVVHVVLEARAERLPVAIALTPVALPGIAADSVQAEHPDPLRELRIRGDDHAALSGGHVLGRIETESTDIAPRAHV